VRPPRGAGVGQRLSWLRTSRSDRVVYRLAMRNQLAIALALIVSTIVTAHAEPTSAPYPKMAPLDQYLIADRNTEVALARTAAPPSISGDATIMVLTARGYEAAVTGKNGFVCLVDRSWQSPLDDAELWNPKIRSPICLNAPAVRSVLPFQMQLTALALSGATREQMVVKVKATLAKSSPPETGAMSYMMSKDQHLNDRDMHWHPHLMFYLPSTIDAPVLGANLPASPVMGGAQVVAGVGTMPVSIYYVPLDKWSDGSPAMAHEH
jgi:hypothetical protein